MDGLDVKGVVVCDKSGLPLIGDINKTVFLFSR